MNIKGKVYKIQPVQQVSDSFKKRDLILLDDSNSQYPQHISVQFTQDKTDLLNGFKAGQEVDIQINIRGREYTDKTGTVKYFNTIEGWKIEGVSGQSNASQSQPQRTLIDEMQDDSEDLPF